tara:strand:+ start:1087 stop:2049 length:963 start_codon:yes stop_codon:yes gene_type:complete
LTKPSPELAAIAARWIKGMVSQNGETLVNMLTQEEALLFCGTADKEVYRGDFFRDNYAAHVNEIPIGQLENVEIDAFESGDMGWAFWHGHISFPNIDQAPTARVTLIFALEQGIWKVQHIHNSFPVSNIEAWGYEHSAFDDLLRAVATADPQVGKTGIAAVMFTDIVDSSKLADILGDARWTDRVQLHMQSLGDEIARADGRLIKTLGDGTMSTFPSARSAMFAAQAIQRNLAEDLSEPRLSVRIGIHTGDVVEAGDDFFGTVVNKAARIANVTGPGEIRVSDATRIMVGGASEFTFEDAARVKLKGLPDDHTIYRLRWT